MNNGFDQSRRNLRCMGCNMNFMGQNIRKYVLNKQSEEQLADSLSYIFPDVEPKYSSCGFCKPGSLPVTFQGKTEQADMEVVENPKPAIDFKKMCEEADEAEASSISSNKVTPKKIKPKKSNKSKKSSNKKKLKKSF